MADELLQRAKDIDRLFVEQQVLTGKLRIGSSDTIGNQVAPYLISAFRQLHPHP